jgi:predicted nucleic acid-binding protein
VILVPDASTVITLARIGRLDLLAAIAETVYIPQAVYDEVVTQGEGRPGRAEVAQARWVARQQVRDRVAVDRLRGPLGRGEAEAIVLAREVEADFLVLDDATARRVAAVEGQPSLGLLGVLLKCEERGVLESLKPVLDQMVAAGFFIDGPLYRVVLRMAGEESPT